MPGAESDAHHPGLRENVLAMVDGSDGDCLMHAGPCPNDDSIEVLIFNDNPPALSDPGNAKLFCHGF
jgi:hypothetical protein